MLLVVPLVAAAAVVWQQFGLGSTGAVTSGLALLGGALLAAFPQLAAWRSRLSQRVEFKATTERPARESVDEAVAHVLWSALLSVLGAVLAAAVENSVPTGEQIEAAGVPYWTWIAMGAALVALSTYLVLTFVVIVNLLWSAYRRASKDEDEEAAARAAKRSRGSAA
ncbi:hypothetical protein FA014_02070 [Cellulomonas hominis]|uniref:Uncharacterized protein n=1 Tax=Cellulomonas hominis TaxID=156981 RepID=A0A7Z8NQM5_9CELL|nr:hypothetical protein [Cellulomonas hominis]TKR27166.1 hypothetical protein FA014_02070 [Cellulomonas hominis]